MNASIPRRLVAYFLDCLLLFTGLLAMQAILYPVNPIVAMQRDNVTFTGGQLHLWVLPFELNHAILFRLAPAPAAEPPTTL